MNAVINQEIILKEKTIPIIPQLFRINWKKSDDLNFNLKIWITINGKNKKIIDMRIKYQKLKRAKFSGKGTEINELILGIIKKGESLDIKKLKDKIKRMFLCKLGL